MNWLRKILFNKKFFKNNYHLAKLFFSVNRPHNSIIRIRSLRLNYYKKTLNRYSFNARNLSRHTPFEATEHDFVLTVDRQPFGIAKTY